MPGMLERLSVICMGAIEELKTGLTESRLPKGR